MKQGNSVPFSGQVLQKPPRVVHTGHVMHGKVREEFYQLHSLWCVHHYEYEADLLMGDRVCPIHPGSITVMPPKTAMRYRFKGLYPHTFAHFTLEDYYPTRPVEPLWLPAIHVSEETRGYFRELVNAWAQDQARAVALLWVLLWRIAADCQAALSSQPAHPALLKALDYIERHLSEPIQAGAVAEHCELSLQRLNYYARLHYGCSLGVYLPRRKMERARHLLKQSDKPVKVVAAEIGMVDLHQFNKFFKQYAGVAPRAYRAAR